MNMIDGSNYPLNVSYVAEIPKTCKSNLDSLLVMFMSKTGLPIDRIELTQRVQEIKTENGIAIEKSWFFRERKSQALDPNDGM